MKKILVVVLLMLVSQFCLAGEVKIPFSATMTGVEILDNGKLVVYYEQPSNFLYATNPPMTADSDYYREIYAVKDGKIYFEKTERKVTKYKPVVKEVMEGYIVWEEKK